MRRLLVVLACALPLAACFGGDDPERTVAEGPEDTAPGPTGVVAEACAAFAGNVVRIVGEPERDVSVAEIRTALEGLAADGPTEVRETAGQLVEAMAIAAIEDDAELAAVLEEMGEERYLEILYGSVLTAEDLVAWAAPVCAPGALAWSCAAHGSPVLVATSAVVEPTPDDRPEPGGGPDDGPVLASVEAVIDDVGRDADPVEISRTGDRVEVGWLDRHDLVTETVVAERRGGGWTRAGGGECANRED